MSLVKYKSKRHFSETSEPGPTQKKSKKKELIFVVQKHAARRLHYDFRIECEGVLKSWAVPKGPSMNPADKRLAIMVEDHPYDYHSFEGIIPEGNYGAGTVMLWDEGTYGVPGASTQKETENRVLEGLKEGHVDLILHGSKLNGAFTLIRLKGDENQWLLFKNKDEFVQKTPVIEQDRSVRTARSMDEIAGKKTDLLQNAPKSKMPTKVQPMLGVLAAKPFDRENWLFEIKWDGYRAIAFMKKKGVDLLSRNGKFFNTMFPQIVEELKELKLDAVLDGEIVILDQNGKPQFQLLQNFQTTRKGLPFYYVFDLIYLNGRDVKELPLRQRKEILKSLLPADSESRIRYCDHIENRGIAFFEKVSKMNLEGMMAKDAESPYVMRRSSYWEKIKTHMRQEVVIGGFTAPKGSRKKFGALLVGVYEGKKLVYAGHVGGGFNQKTLNEMYSQMEPLITEKSPFSTKFSLNSPVTWIKPKIVAEVSFAEWTSEGIMRQPIFKGVRIDKKPMSVVREL